MKKFTVEFEVADVWIEDGFELTDEVARLMIEHVLPYAYDYELKARVINVTKSRKPPISINKECCKFHTTGGRASFSCGADTATREDRE